MGTWGYAVTSDDTVRDVLDTFKHHLKHGATEAEATGRTLREFAELESDPDEGPLLWLGLAEAQWAYGAVDPAVLDRVRDNVASGAGLERWEESPADLVKRQRALAAFVAKVERPNPRPRKRPRLVVRPPEFEPGACLAIRGRDGLYRAAVVVAADHSNPEYGKNLIALLDYRSAEQPGSEVFERRRWARRRRTVPVVTWAGDDFTLREEVVDEVDAMWYSARIGFRAERDRFKVVGQTELRSDDPQESPEHLFPYTSWRNLGRE